MTTNNPYWLDVSSAFFKDVPLNDDSDKEELALKIKSACEFIERYCNRQFAKKSHQGVFTVRQDGSLILDHPPISTIDRVCYSNGGYLSVRNSTAYSPSYTTGQGFTKLSQFVSGVRAEQVFRYVDYPTLGDMSEAIMAYGHGWHATTIAGSTDTGYQISDLPSLDIVNFQMGTARTAVTLLSWIDYAGMLFPSVFPTRGYYLQYDVDSGILDWFFPRGMRLRVDYVGGFDPIPSPILEVTSRLVMRSSEKKSETIGQYSYTMNFDDLPNSDKKILSRYKDRGC